jgi:hypothetical protein
MRRIKIGPWIWELVKASLWCFLGLACGLAGFVYAINHDSDSVMERWSYTDGEQTPWDCSRVPGVRGVCRTVQSGELKFCHDCPEPFACVIERTRAWQSIQRGGRDATD